MTLPCDAFCDAPSSRLMDQAIAKFSERSAFANASAMDMYNQMMGPIMSETLNTVQMHGMAGALLSLNAVQGA